jgi:hypothetical protein
LPERAKKTEEIKAIYAVIIKSDRPGRYRACYSVPPAGRNALFARFGCDFVEEAGRHYRTKHCFAEDGQSGPVDCAAVRQKRVLRTFSPMWYNNFITGSVID